MSEVAQREGWKRCDDPRAAEVSNGRALTAWYAERVDTCTYSSSSSSPCVCWQCDPYHSWWSWSRSSSTSVIVTFRTGMDHDADAKQEEIRWWLTPEETSTHLRNIIQDKQQHGFVYCGTHAPRQFYSTKLSRQRWLCPHHPHCDSRRLIPTHPHAISYYHPSVAVYNVLDRIATSESPLSVAAWHYRSDSLSMTLHDILPFTHHIHVPHILLFLKPSHRRCWKIANDIFQQGKFIKESIHIITKVQAKPTATATTSSFNPSLELDTRLVSKVFGLPFLSTIPHNEAWPSCTHCGGVMTFLFQLVLSTPSLPRPIAHVIRHGIQHAHATDADTDSVGVTLLQFWFCAAYLDWNRGCCPTTHAHDADDTKQKHTVRHLLDEPDTEPRYQIRYIRTGADPGQSPEQVNTQLYGVNQWDMKQDEILIAFTANGDDIPHIQHEPTFPELTIPQQEWADFDACHSDDITTQPRHGDKLGGFPRFTHNSSMPNHYPTCPDCATIMTFILQIGSEGRLTPNIRWGGDGGQALIFQCMKHPQQLQLIRQELRSRA